MRSDYVAIPWEGGHHPRVPAPHGLGLRGFGIYVGIDAGAADAAGVDVATVVGEVRRAITGIPGAETFTSVVLAPPDTPEPPLSVVRTAWARSCARCEATATGSSRIRT